MAPSPAGLFLRLRFGLRLHLRRFPSALAHIHRADWTDGIHRTSLVFLGTGADRRGFLRLPILQQRHQVGFIRLIQEVNGGLLVLVGRVGHDVKIVACFRGHGDKLLVTVIIVHQRSVALRGKGLAFQLHAPRWQVPR